MGAPALVLVLALGAAVVALWAEVRWPNVTPASGGARIVHVVIALVVVQFVVPPLMAAVIDDGKNVTLDLAALFLIFLPAQVYAFLSAIWLLKSLRTLLQTRY